MTPTVSLAVFTVEVNGAQVGMSRDWEEINRVRRRGVTRSLRPLLHRGRTAGHDAHAVLEAEATAQLTRSDVIQGDGEACGDGVQVVAEAVGEAA